jgi:hypothetical protein
MPGIQEVTAMPTYRINGRHINERDVEADVFDEQGSFVVFSDEEGMQVFAMPTRSVLTIELLDDDEPDGGGAAI